MNPYGNVSGEPVNSPTEKPIRTRSRFPSLSYHFYNTERFGEYNVPFVMDCVEGDKVPIRSGGHVSSYTLKAPLMQSISKKKDFYLVPMEAILPKNWQKFYTNPIVGMDVPDDCGTGVEHFWQISSNVVAACLNEVSTYLASSNPSGVDILNRVFRTLVIAEYFYGQGSLIKSLNASGNRLFKLRYNSRTYSFDDWFDEIVTKISSLCDVFEFKSDGETYYVINNEATEGYRRCTTACVSMRTFLQLLREDLTTYISVAPPNIEATLVTELTPFFDNVTWQREFKASDVPYDLRRLWAYQLTCAHFYSNDFLDYIYSADLFRNLIDYFVFVDYSGSNVVPTFACNGLLLEYDSMSAHCFATQCSSLISSVQYVLSVTNQSSPNHQRNRNLLGYFSALFSYRRSLRYVDYFTGARSRPLAVGDVNVNVNNNMVNVVDVSRNIQRQRFFNAVNRFGRKFEDYIKGLSGISVAVDYHNPLYLAHTSDTVFGVQVENTGAAQLTDPNSVTSRFQTNGSRYQFEFEVDRPCVVIGISYYDMPRAYTNATERQLLHLNRFDMFNPFMQFIGDQVVNSAELGSSVVDPINFIFAYQLRHMEYKQRFDQAAGGFIDGLPGYLFTDKQFAAFGVKAISPHFIRSLNSELDPYYVALTGFSLGHYFHFIVDNDNVCDASRPMAFAPSIL